MNKEKIVKEVLKELSYCLTKNKQQKTQDDRTWAVINKAIELAVDKTWAEAEKEIENAYEEGIDGINNKTAIIEDWKHLCEEKDNKIKDITDGYRTAMVELNKEKDKEIKELKEKLNTCLDEHTELRTKAINLRIEKDKTLDKVEKRIKWLKRELKKYYKKGSWKFIESTINEAFEEIRGLKS